MIAYMENPNFLTNFKYCQDTVQQFESEANFKTVALFQSRFFVFILSIFTINLDLVSQSYIQMSSFQFNVKNDGINFSADVD